MRSEDLKRFIREEQAILRREQADKRRRFLEEHEIRDNKIEAYLEKENSNRLSTWKKVALHEEREDYRPVLERLEKIKEKYRLIREQKIRERVTILRIRGF